MDSLVSIIIPTYKRNENLEKSIKSVLNQSYENIEVIVVDDNDPSTEYRKNTEKLMKEYEKNSKVIYIKHEKNKNGAVARNTGIKASKGEYIGFLDDDDEFLEDKIKKQVQFLEQNNKYDCVGCQIYKKNRIVKQKINQKTLLRDILSLKVSPITSTLLFTRKSIEQLKGFNESYRRHQDVEIVVRFLQKNRLFYIEEPLTIIGTNNGENQVKGEKLDELKKQFITEFMPIIEQLDKIERGSKRKILCAHYVATAINHLKNRNYKLLKKVLKISYKTYPITFLVYFIKSVLSRILIHIKWRKLW